MKKNSIPTLLSPVHADSDQLLTEKQAASIVNLSTSTLQKYRHFGKGLPYVKFGRAIRYPLSAITAFIAAHQIQPR